jgi:hypothetical protein
VVRRRRTPPAPHPRNLLTPYRHNQYDSHLQTDPAGTPVSELKHSKPFDLPADGAGKGSDVPVDGTDWLDRLIAAKQADATRGREPYAAHLDKPLSEGEPTPRETLDRFDPKRANLPDVSPTDAVEYIEIRAADRPWLTSARGHDTAVQRLFAALDQGQGHALERHEGYPPDSLPQRRHPHRRSGGLCGGLCPRRGTP